MGSPTFAHLKSKHYSSDRTSADFVDGTDLYDEVGQDFDKLQKQDPGYANTCATRMSLALLKAGVPFAGRLKVKKGEHKGRAIEPGAKRLADQLSLKSALGKPEILSAKDALTRLEGRKGVVFFWKMAHYSGGHIDLIEVNKAAATCHSACYMDSKEIWFWELK